MELGSFSLGFADGGWLGQNGRSQGRVVAAHRDLWREIICVVSLSTSRLVVFHLKSRRKFSLTL